MKKIIIVISCLLVMMSCTDKEGATKVLIQSGYHPIKVGGYGWFQEGGDDVYCTKFKAYSNDSSQIVEGVVTSGWFKNKTIRLN